MEKSVSEITKSGIKKMLTLKKFSIHQALTQPNQTSQGFCNDIKMEMI